MKDLLKKEYLHLGTDHIYKELWQNIQMDQLYQLSKPYGGLWTSHTRFQNNRLCDWIDYLADDEYELERLRDLYKLDQNYSDYEKIGAHVIANNGTNWFSDFTIDKGSADGIKVNCNVLAGSGLVGLVTEVGPHYARVRSIIDNSSNVSAMILSTSDTCIVRGDLKLMDDGRLRFEKLANNDNDIQVGEQVVTSYVSDRFVQGLFIGYISEIDVDSNNLTRSGYITPAVDFSKIQEVLVLTKTKEDMTNGADDKSASDTAKGE